jgi:hypothetical protein
MPNAPSAKPIAIALGRAVWLSSQTSLQRRVDRWTGGPVDRWLSSHDSESPVPIRSEIQVAQTSELRAPPPASGSPVASRKPTVALTTVYEPSVIPANATTRQKGRILPDAS